MLSKKTIAGITAAVVAILFLLPGCYKDKAVVSESGPAVTRTVSFASDLIPMFTKSCALSGCHASGGHVPDLSSGNAYNSLKVGNYYNTGNPEGSTIYLWLTGKKTTQMPPAGLNKEYNALVLAWIKQGAKNN